jgi:hypothetical protein
VLNANDVVSPTGKNMDGSWLQIEFAAGPDGKGWVSAGFVKAENVDNLPIVSDLGEVVGTGTPVDTPLAPTPTLIPAPMDFDSADAPIKTGVLGGAGASTILYNGDVSFPEGDTEDWILVTPQEDMLFAGIECSESNSIKVEFVGTAFELACNEANQAIPVSKNSPLLIHIQAVGNTGQLNYTKYRLMLEVRP